MQKKHSGNGNNNEPEKVSSFIYEGPVVVVERGEDIKKATDILKNEQILGFDTETRPSFKKGEVHDVSLLQLAAENVVYLFRLHKCGFPEAIRDLLADPGIIKVGVGIKDDIRFLNRIGKFEPANFVDLQSYAEEFGIADKSFSKLMDVIFQVKISKKMRISNWELPVLSESQIRYAATDAWGSMKMYKELTRNWKKVPIERGKSAL